MFLNLRIFTTILVLLPIASAAQDYVHCYIGEAPADAPVSTTENLQGFLPTVQITTLRHGCGHATADDKAMLANLVAKGGCSTESDAFTFAMSTFLDSPAETLAWRKEDAGDEALMASLCSVSAACTPGDVGYGSDCQAKIADAMVEAMKDPNKY